MTPKPETTLRILPLVGDQAEFEFVERHAGGGSSTSFFPAIRHAEGFQLDRARCPNMPDDAAAFARLLDKFLARHA